MNQNNFSVRPVEYRGISPYTKKVPYINELPQILAFLRKIDAERDIMINMDIPTMDKRIRADMDDLKVIWMIFCDEHKYVGMCSLQAMHSASFQKYKYYLDDFYLCSEYCRDSQVNEFYKLVKNWVILNDGDQIFCSLENSNKLCAEILYKSVFQEINQTILIDKWDN